MTNSPPNPAPQRFGRIRPERPIDPALREASLQARLNEYAPDLHAGLRWLVQRFPIAFSPEPARVRPLKIGIHADIAAIAAEEAPWLSQEMINRILTRWTASPAYRAVLGYGKQRRDLDGNRVAPSWGERTLPSRDAPVLQPEALALWTSILCRRFAEFESEGRSPDDAFFKEVRAVWVRTPDEAPEGVTLARLWTQGRALFRAAVVSQWDRAMATAKRGLSSEGFEAIHQRARAQGDDAAFGAIAREYEHIVAQITALEVQRMRRSLTQRAWRQLGTEVGRLEQELATVRKRLAAAGSVAQAFVAIATVELPPDDVARMRANLLTRKRWVPPRAGTAATAAPAAPPG